MGEPVPYFDPKLEVPVDKIPDALASTSRNHVTVIVKMHWMFNEASGITKYSFVTGNNLQFEVDFTGDIRLKLSGTVLVCLKGAQLIPRPTSKSTKLPFKLVFPDGAMLKVGEQIIDTFQEAPPSPVVPSWFASQPHREPSPSPPRTPSGPEGTPSPPRREPEEQPESPPHAERERVSFFVQEPQDIKPNITSPSCDSTPAKCRNLPHPTIHAGPVNENQLPKKRPRSSTPEPPSNHPQRNTGSGSGSSRVSDLVQVEAPAKEDTSVSRPKKKRRRKGGKSNANQPTVEQTRNPALDMTAGFDSHLIGTFSPLGDLGRKTGGKVAVVGVVRGITVPRLTRNGDLCATTELLDPSNLEQPFVVTMFLPNSLGDCMPSVKAGDIIILVKITLVVYQGQPRATGYGDSFQWAGYSPSEKRHFHSTHRTFLDEEHCPFFTPTQDELQYAGKLAEWWKATQEVAKSKADGSDALIPGTRGRQLITLAETQPGIFFKSVVEVLFKIPPTGQFAEFLITDYTVHPQFLPRQPREEGKPEKQDQIKVYGKRVLRMTLWGEVQLEHAQEIEPGYYYIDNLRVKIDSKGYLEGTLQDDRRKIDKLRKDDPMLEDLLKRKEKYFSEPASPTLNASKGPRRDFNLHSAGDLLPAPAVPPPRQIQPKKQGPALTRLLYENVVQTPMQKLLGHASCPEIFRIRARIIAFEPYSLKHFTYGYCTNCNADFLPDSKACHPCEDFDGKYTAYEYRIRLCVEEESNPAPVNQEHRLSMVVDLSGKDAEMFFSGIPPSDLHDVKNARALRNRFAPILGNLEIFQNDLARGDSGKALEYGQYFDMLIQSYKAAVKGENSLGNKRYKIWGTELLPQALK